MAGAGEGPALRIADPQPEQTVFPFHDPDSARVLAIPIEDLGRWLGRTDCQRPMIAVFHQDWMSDDRFHRFARRIGAHRVDVQRAVLALAQVCTELLRNQSARGLGRPGMRLVESLVSQWFWPDDGPAVFEAVIRSALAEQILLVVDSSVDVIARQWEPHRRRAARKPDGGSSGGTSGSALQPKPDSLAPDCVHTRTHGVRAAYVDLNGTDSNRERIKNVGNSEVQDEKRRVEERPGEASSHGAAPRSRRAAKGGLADMLAELAIVQARDGARLALRVPDDKLKALLWFSDAVRAIRERGQRSAWPAAGNRQDHDDLRDAVSAALRDRRGGDLAAVLTFVAEWADSGRAFHVALRDCGFLPRARRG